jgi:hypothetical protein
MSTPKNNPNCKEAPELTSEEIAVVARWAEEVDLYAGDLYDQSEEARLRQNLQKTDLEKLAPALKETLLNGLEEEEACAHPEDVARNSPSPLVGLVRDYSKAQPMEKALINLVLRRLANLTVPWLVSFAVREYKRKFEKGGFGD